MHISEQLSKEVKELTASNATNRTVIQGSERVNGPVMHLTEQLSKEV